MVVTVTYSPGPHLNRFLASLSHATDRAVTVIMADNGSTDGAPEEALEHYPNVRLLRTGANLGYGTAVNRAVDEFLKDDAAQSTLGFFHRRQSRCPVGAAQHRHPLGRGGALATGGCAGAVDPRSGRHGVPVGAPSAQPDPGRHARGRRAAVAIQSVDRRLPAGRGLRPANGPSDGCRARACCCGGQRSMRWQGSTSAISCTWRTLT